MSCNAKTDLLKSVLKITYLSKSGLSTGSYSKEISKLKLTPIKRKS